MELLGSGKKGSKAVQDSQDVEGLREQYALTVRAWLKGMEKNRAHEFRFVD